MAYEDNENDLAEKEAADLVTRAKDNVTTFNSNTSDYQEVAEDDTKFINGDPWTDKAKKQRGKRPMPVINDAVAYKRKVLKEYKNNPSGIKATPANNNETTKETAQAFQGIIDKIMRDSQGEDCQDIAFGSMLDCGMGYSYLDTEYENDHSFNQNIIICPIKDKFSVAYDKTFTRLNMVDMEWASFNYIMSRKAYEEEYPDAMVTGFPTSSEFFKHVEQDTIMLCRYYERSYEEDTLISFVDPTEASNDLLNILKGELKDPKYATFRTQLETDDLYKKLKETDRILASRTVEVPKIKWYILNGSEVLDEGDWAGRFIPIIPMLGNEYKLDGSTYLESLIRWSKDPSRMYNYLSGNILESLALQPLTPAIGMAGQFNGHEHAWARANNEPLPYLLYNPIKLPDGTYSTQAPIPTQPAQVPQGNIAAAQMVDMDKKTTMGIHDGAMGIEDKAESGKAILARSSESLDNINVFIQKRKQSTHYLGLVLVDLIPHYYDAARTIKILGKDGTDKTLRINDESEKDYINIKDADFDVYIDEGPTYASQRKESQATYTELAKVMPEYLDTFADKVVEYLDGPDSKEITQRVQKRMDPKFFVEEGEKTTEQLENELAQKDQQIQQLTSQNEEMEKVLIGEETKVKSQKEIATMKEQGAIQRENIKAKVSLEKERMSNQADITESEISARNNLEVEALKQSMAKMSSNMEILLSRG